MQKILFVLLFTALLDVVTAKGSAMMSDSLARYSREVEWKSFDEQKISSYREDSDFDYDVNPDVKSNFLYNFFNAIWKWLTGNDLNGIMPDSRLLALLLRWGLYLIMAAAIVFAIVQLLKMRSSGAMQKQSANVVDHDVLVENIHEIDFAKSIREARENKKFRLVIRLYYLYALKLLSDREKLSWQPWKTNYDYQLELKDEGLRSHFHLLGYYFEFIWYGNFEVTENILKEVEDSFVALEQVKQ